MPFVSFSSCFITISEEKALHACRVLSMSIHMQPCCSGYDLQNSCLSPIQSNGSPNTLLVTSACFCKTEDKWNKRDCFHSVTGIATFKIVLLDIMEMLSKCDPAVCSTSLQKTPHPRIPSLCLCMLVFMQAVYGFKNHFLLRTNVLHSWAWMEAGQSWKLLAGHVCFEACWIYPGKTQRLLSKSTISGGPSAEVLRKSLIPQVEFVSGESEEQEYGTTPAHLLFWGPAAVFLYLLPLPQGQKKLGK